MRLKHILTTVISSVILGLILLFLVYDFEITKLYMANILFIVGVLYFFPGLIIVSGSAEMFRTVTYLGGRMFRKNKEGVNESFAQYSERKNLERMRLHNKHVGYIILITGGSYIIISMIFSFLT